MPNAARKSLEDTVTDVALLQKEVNHLHGKVDELKGDVKDLHECLDRNMYETREFLEKFQAESNKQHGELSEKVSGIEKIKWMLMGAAAILGATSVEAVKMFLIS
jgi:polyhydroxyalkanoate synthesis regulator phasin